MSHLALIDSFKKLCKCKEGSSKDVIWAIRIFVVYFSEVARIQRNYKVECRSFVTYEQPILDAERQKSFCVDSLFDSTEENNSFWIRNYGYYYGTSMFDTEDRLASKGALGIQINEGGNLKSPIKVFGDVEKSVSLSLDIDPFCGPLPVLLYLWISLPNTDIAGQLFTK